MVWLAWDYDYGEDGQRQDLSWAAALYRAAAAQNLTTAQYRLGRNFEDGRGVPQNSKKAAKFVSDAIYHGDKKALAHLSQTTDQWSKAFWMEMQHSMKELGIYKAKTDGNVGPDTLAGLKKLAAPE